MKELLESKGWQMYYECSTCGHKQHFTHKNKKGYEVRCRVRNNTFSIFLNNMKIAGPFFGYEIEQKLIKYAE